MNSDARLAAEIEREWQATGLSGTFVARHLDSGRELGFGAETVWPLASVIKLPVALVVYDAFDRGDLEPGEEFEILPGTATEGPSGVSLFRHRSRIAAEDLIQLSLALSDNAATDLLLERLGIGAITRRLAALGCSRIVLRHPMRALYGLAGAAEPAIGVGIAGAGGTSGGGHVIEELDLTRANIGTGRSLLDLLERVWTDSVSTAAVCARLREALGHQLVKHRMAVDLASDAVRVRSKTGSFLDLRHEAGVVEAGTDRIAVVALTRSTIPAHVHLEADFAIGQAARAAVDALRG
jgi:beta-lactamase class A